MVKLLADLHGGAVTAESTVGEGSCFTVWLPLRPPEPAAIAKVMVPALHQVAAPAGTRVALDRSGEQLGPYVRVVEPLTYRGSLTAQLHAAAVLTDSGGVQREAYLWGIRCVTLREETEWVDTVEAGWSALVGVDADAFADALTRPAPAEHPPIFGDGHAAQRIAQIVAPLMKRWPNIDPEAIAEANRKQATIPSGATVLEPVGTAPGLVVAPADGVLGAGHPTVVVLPGPPRELQPMWETAVATEAFQAAIVGATAATVSVTTVASSVAGVPGRALLTSFSVKVVGVIVNGAPVVGVNTAASSAVVIAAADNPVRV